MNSEIFDPVSAVLINEDEGNICEITIDISPKRNEIYKLLKGVPTFIGQFPNTNVVIMKCGNSPFDLMRNRNILPHPFNTEKVNGPILLLRMNDLAEPLDFKLNEYMDSKIYPRV